MKRPSYRDGVQWIAWNDDAGSDGALDPKEVRCMISTGLLADLFGKTTEQVARDIIVARKKAIKEYCERA